MTDYVNNHFILKCVEYSIITFTRLNLTLSLQPFALTHVLTHSKNWFILFVYISISFAKMIVKSFWIIKKNRAICRQTHTVYRPIQSNLFYYFKEILFHLTKSMHAFFAEYDKIDDNNDTHSQQILQWFWARPT